MDQIAPVAALAPAQSDAAEMGSPESRAIYDRAHALLNEIHALVSTAPSFKDTRGQDTPTVFFCGTLGISAPGVDQMQTSFAAAGRGDQMMVCLLNLSRNFHPSQVVNHILKDAERCQRNQVPQESGHDVEMQKEIQQALSAMAEQDSVAKALAEAPAN